MKNSLKFTARFPSWGRLRSVCQAGSGSLACILKYKSNQSGTLMPCRMRSYMYVSEERSSETPFLLPLAVITMCIIFEMVSLTCDVSVSSPKMNALPSTQEIDSLYFALTSFNEAITSLHVFNTVLFLVVGRRVVLFCRSSRGKTQV